MLDLEKMRKSLGIWREKASAFTALTWRQCLTAGVIFLALTLILSSNFLFAGVSLGVGEIAPRDITAPKTIDFVDRYKTQQLEEKAVQSVEGVYDFKLQAINQVKLDISNTFTSILDNKNNSALQKEEKIKGLTENLPVKLSEKALNISLSLSTGKLAELEDMAIKLVGQMMDTGIKEEKIQDARIKLGDEIEELPLTGEEKLFLKEVTQKAIAPNLLFNYVKTEKEREKARQSVEPVRQIIRKGLIIIRRGDQVTPEHVALLEALGLQRPRINYQTIGGLAGLSLLTLLLLGAYLWQYRKDILGKESRLYLLGIILLFITFLSKMINTVAIASFSSSTGYLAPVATGTMLITILLDPKLAILVNVVLSSFVGMMNNNDLGVFMVVFFGGMAGIYSVSRLMSAG